METNKADEHKKARKLIGETVTVSGIVTADQSAIGMGNYQHIFKTKQLVSIFILRSLKLPRTKSRHEGHGDWQGDDL